jgi:hypothetical protein
MRSDKMHVVAIGIVIIVIYNYYISYNNLDKVIINRYLKYKRITDTNLISELEEVKKKLGIDNQVFLLHNSNSIQNITFVKEYKNIIYIVINGEINPSRFTGLMAHELSHRKLKHHEEYEKYNQISNFLFNIFLLSILTYPVIPLTYYFYILFISFFLASGYTHLVCFYISRKQELEADTLATKVVGGDAMLRFCVVNGADSFIGSLPSFMSDHPSLKTRIRNIRRIDKSL